MGRKRIHMQPSKQVRVFAGDASRIRLWQGLLAQPRSKKVSKSDVVSSALDALEQKLSREGEAHVTVTG